MKLSRREFIKYTGVVAAAGAASAYFVERPLLGTDPGSESAPALQSTNRVKVVRTTCSPNDTGACGINATVSDGRIVTLMPADDYPEPEYNPRGCLRGLSMTNLIYGPDRLKHPLIRVGKRGEGKFRVATWDEALDYAASGLLDVMNKYGGDSVALSVQVPCVSYIQKGTSIKLASMFGWSVLHGYSMNGDLPMFWPMTFGVQSEELESLEWANSKYIAIFGSNIMATRLPDSKFLVLAQERGAKLLVVDPNYSPTASKADEWVPVNPSTDSALAMGIAGEIINKGLYDETFVKTFTDLPLLVRSDNSRRLRARDVRGLAEQTEKLKGEVPEYRDLFLAYDTVRQRFAIADPERLGGELDSALEGEFEAELTSGEKVKVRPAFDLLKELVTRDYSPLRVARVISPDEARIEEYASLVQRLASEMATVKPLHIVHGVGNYQWYHGDLKGRALTLIVALTGNIGHSGDGISTYSGGYKFRWPLGAWWSFQGRKPKWVNHSLWLNEEYRKGEEFAKYNTETPHPENGVKALVFCWNNPIEQHNQGDRLSDMAESGELEFIVGSDFQMTSSCRWADVVLPGLTWYEKHDVTANTPHPYTQLQQPAIEPLFEGMPEIWIFKEFARRITAKWGDAKLRDNIAHFCPDSALFRKEESARQFGPLGWSLAVAREIADEAALAAARLIFETGGPMVEGITVERLKMEGAVRLNLPIPGRRQILFWEQIHEGKPFPPRSLPAPLAGTARFVKSGRIEFYKDEDVFIDLGEQLPVHKDPFVDTEYRTAGTAEKYKFAYITRVSLYRVHSTHSNNITMLELQDFKPKIFVNPDTGREKGLNEGDLAKVYNDRGVVYGHAVFDPGIHPRVVVFEEGWSSNSSNGARYNSLTFPWVKPTSFCYFVPGIWEPSSAWNETACDIVKA